MFLTADDQNISDRIISVKINNDEENIMRERKPSIEDELGLAEPEVELENTDIESKGYEKDIDDDYKLARKHLYHAMVRATELIDSSVREMVANPTAMGVKSASDAIKVLTDNTYRLMELHDKIRDAKDKDKEKQEEEVVEKEQKKMSFNNIVALVKRAQNE